MHGLGQCERLPVLAFLQVIILDLDKREEHPADHDPLDADRFAVMKILIDWIHFLTRR